MLPGLTLPASLLEMLAVLRPCFTAPGFVTFCGLSVLARLHLPGKGAGPGRAETAAALVSQLALAFPARLVHVVADAAYHGPALRTLPGNVTWTCRRDPVR